MATKRKKTGGMPGFDPLTDEIIYVFKNVKMKCELNPEVYNEHDRIEVEEMLDLLSKEIYIDKTYVDFKGTKYKKTYLFESGWNELKHLVISTDFGKKCSGRNAKILDETLKMMLPGYFDILFYDLGWDVNNMVFELVEDSTFDVEFQKDECNEWKTYIGPWQEWKNDK